MYIYFVNLFIEWFGYNGKHVFINGYNEENKIINSLVNCIQDINSQSIEFYGIQYIFNNTDSLHVVCI